MPVYFDFKDDFEASQKGTNDKAIKIPIKAKFLKLSIPLASKICFISSSL